MLATDIGISASVLSVSSAVRTDFPLDRKFRGLRKFSGGEFGAPRNDRMSNQPAHRTAAPASASECRRPFGAWIRRQRSLSGRCRWPHRYANVAAGAAVRRWEDAAPLELDSMMRSRSTKMSLPWSSTGDATFQSRRDGIFVARAYDKYLLSPIGAAYSAIHPDSSYNNKGCIAAERSGASNYAVG
jgi:hypothetical protein